MAQSPWNAKRKKIHQIFARYVDDRMFSGNVLVAKDGEVIFRGSAGFADRPRRRKLTEHSMFNIASVGKTMTAAAILLAVQRGRIKLDQTLERWFPELPYRHVTVRQLLSHTSGIPNYIAMVRRGELGDQWEPDEQPDSRQLLAAVSRLRPTLDFIPGAKNEYSNTGYLVLSLLIERLFDVSFHDFLEQELFRPFGFKRLTECHLPDRAALFSDYAIGYYLEHETATLPHLMPGMSFVFQLDLIQGDGNFHSSTDELLRWDRLLRSGDLVSLSLLEEAYTPVRLNDGTYSNYGLGWFVKHDAGYGLKVEHSGYWPGYHAEFIRYLNEDMTIILLSNEEYPNSYKAISRMAAEFEAVLHDRSVCDPSP